LFKLLIIILALGGRHLRPDGPEENSFAFAERKNGFEKLDFFLIINELRGCQRIFPPNNNGQNNTITLTPLANTSTISSH